MILKASGALPGFLQFRSTSSLIIKPDQALMLLNFQLDHASVITTNFMRGRQFCLLTTLPLSRRPGLARSQRQQRDRGARGKKCMAKMMRMLRPTIQAQTTATPTQTHTRRMRKSKFCATAWPSVMLGLYWYGTAQRPAQCVESPCMLSYE